MAASSRYLPPEWHPQSAVLLTWPHADSDFGPMLDRVEPVFLALAVAISRQQGVIIVAQDPDHATQIEQRLTAAGVPAPRMRLAICRSDDVWSRDFGPITVLDDGQPRLLDFRFNGWGNKYPAALDDAVTGCLQAQGLFPGTPVDTVDLVFEGGSMECDGAGTLLTTRRCLGSPQRNPGLSEAQINQRLREQLGVERVIWLEHGELEGDDTDAHIDTLVRFADAQTLLYVACDDPADSHHAGLQAMAAELRALRTRQGEPYRLIPLPHPRAIHAADGRRLPATYANFLVINGAVLAPVYGDAADARALAQLREAFPDREVHAIDCRPLIAQNGSLHCVTMQLPAELWPAPFAAEQRP